MWKMWILPFTILDTRLITFIGVHNRFSKNSEKNYIIGKTSIKYIYISINIFFILNLTFFQNISFLLIAVVAGRAGGNNFSWCATRTDFLVY